MGFSINTLIAPLITPFTAVFVAALLISTGLRLLLAGRQIRHVAQHRSAVPEAFVQTITLTSHQKAADYTVARTRLNILSILWDAVLLVALLLLGGLQLLNDSLAAHTPPGLWRELWLIGIVSGLLFMCHLPFNLYRRFKIEARFGFNRMTPGLYARDLFKGLVLALLLGGPLMAALLALMMYGGNYWWVWGWGLWTIFNLTLLVLYPTTIAPLFNTFKPLADDKLNVRIQELAQRCRFAIKAVFVMDGSTRSSHGNAYFTGLGRAKRIVFFDTLLKRLVSDEIIAVLAHELGHFHHRHILRRLLWGMLSGAALFALLGYAAQQLGFYTSLGVYPDLLVPHPAIALILFALVAPVFSFFTEPLGSWLSRRDEFQADRFAARQASSHDLISALTKLYQDNAATLTPDPLHSAFYDSHPPAQLRISRLQALDPSNKPAATA